MLDAGKQNIHSWPRGISLGCARDLQWFDNNCTNGAHNGVLQKVVFCDVLADFGETHCRAEKSDVMPILYVGCLNAAHI